MFNASRRPAVGFTTFACLFALVSTSCTPTTEPIAAAAQSAPQAPEPNSVTLYTDTIQLFMEYPRLVVGEEARFLAHVTVLGSGEPIRSGTLRIEVSGSPSVVLTAEAPKRDGLFIPIGTFDTAGQFSARVVVESEQATSTIPLESFVVHANILSALEAARADESPEPADAVPFLLEQQWKIGMLTGEVQHGSLTERIIAPAEIEAPHHSLVIVSSPLAGRLVRPETDDLPHVGERVEKGQVLAWIEPPLTLADAAQLGSNKLSQDGLETELLLRGLELQTRALEVEQAGMQAAARLAFAQQALARIQELRSSDLGTVAKLESAQRDLALAENERDGAEELRTSLMTARAQLDALRTASVESRPETSENKRVRIPLVAPIAGEIIEANCVEGQNVEVNGPVFQLLDPAEVWIATHVSEFDIGRIGENPSAVLTLPAYPDRSFDVLRDLSGHVVHKSRVVDPETRTIALRYEATNLDGLFRIGMFANAAIETGTAIDALTIPATAIVQETGRPVAYVVLAGELLQKRELELGLRDDGLVEVRSGLAAGERVVTYGAYFVKLAAASPASFGEGHTH